MDSQGSSSSQDSQDSTLTIMDDNRREILYFAYGSNLSTEQMRERCPYSTAVGLGKMTGWKWIINRRGYANVVKLGKEDQDIEMREEYEGSDEEYSEEEGEAEDGEVVKERKGKGILEDSGEQAGEVYGMLYLLPTEDEERLDRYEGVPWAYEKAYLEADWVSHTEAISTNGGTYTREELTPVKVLVYIDRKRVQDGKPKEEYVGRMERGIRDAVDNWGLSEEYADRVMRKFWVDG
jgi:gamma-glutamylcyclotransferase